MTRQFQPLLREIFQDTPILKICSSPVLHWDVGFFLLLSPLKFLDMSHTVNHCKVSQHHHGMSIHTFTPATKSYQKHLKRRDNIKLCISRWAAIMLSAKLELTGAYLLVSRKSTYRKTWLDIVIDNKKMVLCYLSIIFVTVYYCCWLKPQ